MIDLDDLLYAARRDERGLLGVKRLAKWLGLPSPASVRQIHAAMTATVPQSGRRHTTSIHSVPTDVPQPIDPCPSP